MRTFLISMLLFTFCSKLPAYQLTGMENSVGHGLAGFAGVTLTYGMLKLFFLHNDKPTLEQRVVLNAMAFAFTLAALTIKEASDDSRCRALGSRNGCFDVGAIGYGLGGAGIANLTTFAFDF